MKVLLGMPPLCIENPPFKSPFHFQLVSLLMVTPGCSRQWLQCLGPYPPQEGFGRNSYLLASACLSPGCWSIWWVNQSLEYFTFFCHSISVFFCCSGFQINTNKTHKSRNKQKLTSISAWNFYVIFQLFLSTLSSVFHAFIYPFNRWVPATDQGLEIKLQTNMLQFI